MALAIVIIAGVVVTILMVATPASGESIMVQNNSQGIVPSQAPSLFAGAIAFAEGAYTPGSFPNRNNNPGDLVDISTGQKKINPSPDIGWTDLQNELNLIASGASHVYSPDMTIGQMAPLWTGNDNAYSWALNVVAYLNQNGVNATINTPLSDVLGV